MNEFELLKVQNRLKKQLSRTFNVLSTHSGHYMGRTIVRREFARTRANSPAFAANSPVFADCSPTFYFREHWRTIGEHSANSREHWRSSREFARSSPRTGEQFARKTFLFDVLKLFGELLFAANNRSPRTIFTQQTVRRERIFGEQSFAGI